MQASRSPRWPSPLTARRWRPAGTSSPSGSGIAPPAGCCASLGKSRRARWRSPAGLWTAEGKKRGLLRGHQARVWAVAFSPDGTTLATSSLDGTVRLWDTATRLPVVTLPRPLAHSVAFSRDGKLLASAGADPAVHVMELADRRKLRPPGRDLDLLQKKYGMRLVGVDLVEE